ncbi:MAG TPA: PQQ-binding-like beta-propeller repeat protein [Gemmataceae bacterium]|nr:PQQ-binding-like beta-propeller repeat protein [Gemmataceae bacterium]
MKCCCPHSRWAIVGAAASLVAVVAVGWFVLPSSNPTTPVEAAQKPDPAGPSDITMFGGSVGRNMVNSIDKNVPHTFNPDAPDPAPGGAAVLWKADLGSKAYGGPIVAGGKVFVGTNNQRPRNPRDAKKNADGDVEPIDKGILMCFEEKTGKFLWQAVHDKLIAGRVNDWPEEGICSTPSVEGNRVYYVSNRCTVVCADVDGMANGNDGIATEKYKTPTDADIVWEYDMMKELNVFPHNMAAGCPLIVGDIIYIVTANGVDEGHLNIPSPEAPSFIALDKKGGKLLWKSSIPGRNIMHGQWSNPAYGEINGVKQVVFPGGDGWLYGFTPETGEVIWKFDCNPKDAVYELGGSGTRNDFIGTPVVHDNKVYIGVGQDPEHSTGIGHFWCFAPTKKGDISPTLEAGKDPKGKVLDKPNPNSCVVWHYGGEEKRPFSVRDFKFGRTMSTACIVDDILYIAELTGLLHCMNAKTGEVYWQFDTKSSIWGSAYYVDGKVFLANDQGDLFIFKHEKTPQKIDELDIKANDMKEARKQMVAKRKEVEGKYLLAKIGFDTTIRSTPVVANGVIWVMTEKTLYAIKTK